jgi:hypothetical protein
LMLGGIGVYCFILGNMSQCFRCLDLCQLWLIFVLMISKLT